MIEDSPVWGDVTCVALDRLRDSDDDPVTESVITDPTQWAVILYEEDGYADAETGEVVAAESIDWSTQDDPEAQPQEGFRHADSVVDKTIYVPEFFCTDYQATGLQLSASMLPPGGSLTSASTGEVDENASEQDKARAAAEAEAARADALRRERRKVIAPNRLGDAALHVRRDFVSKLLTRPSQRGCNVRGRLPAPRQLHADPARRTRNRRRTARHRRRRHPQRGQRPAGRQRQPRIGDRPGCGVGFSGSSLMWRIYRCSLFTSAARSGWVSVRSGEPTCICQQSIRIRA